MNITESLERVGVQNFSIALRAYKKLSGAAPVAESAWFGKAAGGAEPLLEPAAGDCFTGGCAVLLAGGFVIEEGFNFCLMAHPDHACKFTFFLSQQGQFLQTPRGHNP